MTLHILVESNPAAAFSTSMAQKDGITSMHQGHEFALMLRKAYLTFHRRVNARVHKSGVTADQFVVLTELLREEGIAQVTIVEPHWFRPEHDRRAAALLERRGLVRREVHAQDARSRCVFLTPEGGRVQRRLACEVEPLLESLGIPSTTSPCASCSMHSVKFTSTLHDSRPICLEERPHILSGDLPVDAAPIFLYVHVLVKPRAGGHGNR